MGGRQEFQLRMGLTRHFLYSDQTYHGDPIGSTSSLQLNSGLGYCVSDQVELYGGLIFQRDTNSPENYSSYSATAYGISGQIIVHIPSTGNAIPFVKGGFGVLKYSGDYYDTKSMAKIFPSVGGGLRFLVGDAASIDTSLTYNHVTDYMGEDDLTANQVYFGVGVSLLFNTQSH